MDTSRMSISLAATMRKVANRHFLFGERARRAIRTVSVEVARAVQDAARVLRIVIFLHSAKDFSSVLRLYGIKNPSETE